MERSTQFLQLIMPSWFEAAVVFLVATIAVVLLVTPSLYAGSEFEVYFSYVERNPTELQAGYNELSEKVNTSELAADISVFGLWALVGLAGYAIISSIMRVIRQTAQFHDELEYSHTDKRAVIIESVIHLGVRLLAVGGLYILLMLLLTRAVPLFALQFRSLNPSDTLLFITNCLLAGALIVVSTHAVTILLRLVALRTRVFYSRL